MFQGAGTNLKSWNEETESKFLNRLQKIGKVYTYQDKVNNIYHYDKNDPTWTDFNPDINFDYKYVNVNTHINMVYNDIIKKYNNYTFIPIGWSAGCLLALYFAQKYKSQCFHVILLEPAPWTPKNMKLRLEEIDNSGINNKPISNIKFKQMLENLKNKETQPPDIYLINDIIHHKRSTFISKYLNQQLSVPTTSFVNIEDPEENNKYSNNKMRLLDVKLLQENNPTNIKAFIFINKGHMIFNKIQPAKKIINHINDVVKSLGSRDEIR
jgi:hypothetical protein